MRKLPFKSESFDGIYSSHTLEHFEFYDVYNILSEFNRVLKKGGLAVLYVPDMEQVFEIAKSDLEEMLYISEAGIVSPIDIIWGMREAIKQGKEHMTHKTGFTQKSIEKKLSVMGFTNILISQENNQYQLKIKAIKQENQNG